MLRTGAVKVLADGSFTARSALLFEPYDDEVTSVGIAIHSGDGFDEFLRRIHLAGLQAAVHAIGDKGVHVTLNAIERAMEAGDCRDARHRIEHAQMVRPADMSGFAESGVIAPIQPSHCIDDMRWVERRLGARCLYAHPYRLFLDAGASVALGTDCNVEPLDPMLGLYAAVTRQFPPTSRRTDPPRGWWLIKTVTVAQAIADYTLGCAYAEFQETQKGSIATGKLADLVLLSNDLLTIAREHILTTKAEIIIVGGWVILQAQ
ncbi:MAG: amidohydrolase family protein [Planctomycetes bacterium]|nr:amidohydrolase family protein [Planctomycetota bacterium]